LAERYGTTESSIGYFYTYFGVLSIIMRGGVLGRLVDKLGEVRVLRLGTLALCGGLALVPFTHTIPASPSSSSWCLSAPRCSSPQPPRRSAATHRAGHLGEFMGLQQAFRRRRPHARSALGRLNLPAPRLRWPFWIGSLLMTTLGCSPSARRSVATAASRRHRRRAWLRRALPRERR
jgi:hypothetical protein